MGTIEKLLNILKNEWPTLSRAPWTFAITFVIAFSVAFAVCRWAYKTIIDGHKERIEGLKERLNGKDAQLDDYRERLHLAPASGSEYSKLTP